MTEALKKTPLAEEHEKLGAKMVPFGGWYMPVQYTGLVEEHTAVREKAGLFDVSHMGEVRVTGKDAVAFVDHLTVNQVTKLVDGQAHYTAFCKPDGTVIDDLLVYRIGPEELLLVINAGNIDKDVAWIEQHVGDFDVIVKNESNAIAQIAIQGPRAEEILQRICPEDLSQINYYWFVHTSIKGLPTLVSRTGYTGEDGFECYCSADHGVRLWNLLLETGREDGLIPAGLGARDTLRLEARMHLYGNDMDETTHILEAGLGWIVKLKNSPEFIGKERIRAQKKAGLERRLVGFEVKGRGIARQGYPIVHEDREVGRVTSGTHSPTLKKAIGLGYVPLALTEPGTVFHVRIRNTLVEAEVVKGPFYKRA